MGEIGFITPELRRLDGLAPGGLLGLFRFAELRPLAGVNGLVDWRLLGHLSKTVIDGFAESAADESLLLPLGERLPHDHLLLLGLGERERFGDHAFRRGVRRMFEQARDLGHTHVTMSLPGRAEGICDAKDAIEWFLPLWDKLARDSQIALIESADAQKTMLPIVERWRLKRDVS
jgi:hypothetical protein